MSTASIESVAALELEAVSVTYGAGRGALTAVSEVSLTVPAGTTVGLVGESGSGKSSLAKAVAGMVPLSQGQLRVHGEDPFAGRSSTTRPVQMVFQDPHSSLNPRMTVGQALAEALELAPASSSHSDVGDLLKQVTLDPRWASRYPHELSGGQLQRVAIARAIAVEPTVLIADEITSALDVSVQAAVLNVIREVQRARRLSMLFISHDLSVVRYVSDYIAVMNLGRVVEFAPAQALFDAPRHPYTRTLLESVPNMRRRERAPTFIATGDVPDPRNPPAGCPFHPRCPVGPTVREDRSVCSRIDPREGADSRPHRAACHFPLS